METKQAWYRRRPALLGGGCIALVLILVLGLGQFQRHLTERKIETKLATIRAQGLPATLAEANHYYTAVSDADNGAILLLSYIPHYIEWDVINDPWVGGLSTNSILIATNLITPQAKTTLASIVASNRTALQYIHQSVTKKAWRFPADLNQWPNVHLQHLPQMKSAVDLLRLEALHHLAESNHSKAITSVEASLLVSDSIAEDPFLISFLVRCACLSIASKSIEHLLQRSEFASADLARLQAAFAQSESKGNLLRAFYGERALIAGSWDQPVSQFRGGGPFSPATPFDQWPAPIQQAGWTVYENGGFKEADLLNFLKFFDELEAAAKQSSPDALRQADDISARLSDAGETALNMILTAHTGPILTHGIRRNAFLTAQYRAVQTALAIERHRLEKGHLPKQLGDLLPAYLKQVPMDPFTGTPLLYRITERGFRVYSIGENGVDDDGKESPRPSNDDIAFSVERDAVTKP